ncbi:MAG: hypothetical protein NT085_00620 [candidate division SR1 bacterium]|nr:hypothetical protein [candidate division SR1 bacterium]
MYTEIIPSIIFASEKLNVGLTFEARCFEDLVQSNVAAITRSINSFQHSKGKISDCDMTIDIGIYVEIIEKGIFLSLQDKKLKFDEETKKSIKKIFIRLVKLIDKLGKHDSDFFSMSTTMRARPSNEVMDFIKKNWGLSSIQYYIGTVFVPVFFCFFYSSQPSSKIEEEFLPFVEQGPARRERGWGSKHVIFYKFVNPK